MLPHVSLLYRRRKPTVETCVDNTAKLRPQASVLGLRAAGVSQLLKLRRQHREATAAFTTSAPHYATIEHLRCTTSGAWGNGLGTVIEYLRRTTSAAANNGLSTTIIPLCSVAAFVVNSEPHNGARSSVRLCAGPELARCAYYKHSE
jgi:hypothetical protein